MPAFRADPRCEVTAIAGSAPGRAEAVARELGIPAAFPDWTSLVGAADVDIVSIATPPRIQPDIAIEAARRGRHLFCEKPLADSGARARDVLAMARATRIVHGIDFLFPEIEVWRQARAILMRGSIGRLQHFAYAWRVETYASRMNTLTWKNRLDEGGGALGNLASHAFYNIEWLLGSVSAIRSFVMPDGSRESRAADGVVELEGGATGTLSISTDAFLGCGHVLEIYGDEGTLVLSNTTSDYANGFTLRLGTRSAPALSPVDVASAHAVVDGRLPLVAALVSRLVDAIEGGNPMSPSLADGARVQDLLDLAAAGHATARAGKEAVS